MENLKVLNNDKNPGTLSAFLQGKLFKMRKIRILWTDDEVEA